MKLPQYNREHGRWSGFLASREARHDGQPNRNARKRQSGMWRETCYITRTHNLRTVLGAGVIRHTWRARSSLPVAIADATSVAGVDDARGNEVQYQSEWHGKGEYRIEPCDGGMLVEEAGDERAETHAQVDADVIRAVGDTAAFSTCDENRLRLRDRTHNAVAAGGEYASQQ